MDNKKFDTQIQYIKYKVLKETAILAWEDKLLENILDIPYKAIPGTKPSMRCCVYKERAIVAERVKLAMGGDRDTSKLIKVLDIACEECPAGGYDVTNACVGCISHRCLEVCKFDAIAIDHNRHAYINKDKCKECGACAKVCPFTAIIHRKRPCENACKIKAITMNENKAARIKYEKCINCGACVKQCPFGAINDKSFILDAIDILKKSENNKNYKVYCVVAPSIATQFSYAKLGQAITGILKVGFYDVIEAAWGADLVAEKGLLGTVCQIPAGLSPVGVAPDQSGLLSGVPPLAQDSE
jgi:Fe-S-cluster-containing hydrogenase component 2